MDLLGSSLGAVERFLNAQLEESTAARELLDTMQDERLGVTLLGPDIELVLEVRGHSLRVRPGAPEEAAAMLRGTPLALLALLRERSKAQLEGTGVSFAGDAETLERFSRLLDLLRPDLEEALSRLIGDVLARHASRAARSGGAWALRALDALALNTAEYLQEESRDLPARSEADGFLRDVERLRDDVERALARVRRLESAAGRDASCADSV